MTRLRQNKKTLWIYRALIQASAILLLVAAVGCTSSTAIQLPPFPPPHLNNSDMEKPSTETPHTQPASPPASETTESQSNAGQLVERQAESQISSLPGVPVFEFKDGEPSWYTVDDDVMGGVSDSKVAVMFSQTGPEDNLVEEYRLLFSGTMSLENNGGFSSVRSDWAPVDLSAYNGILLRVLGDGKSYRLRIRTAEFGSSISYNALFRTEANQWRLAYVPFEAMIPTRRGFRMSVGPLNPADVASFGLMLSDKQPGEFALQVDWMRAVTTEDVEALRQTLIQ